MSEFLAELGGVATVADRAAIGRDLSVSLFNALVAGDTGVFLSAGSIDRASA